jgi:hypothetical protein
LSYNATNSKEIKGRYLVDMGSGYIIMEGDAHWRFIESNVSDSGTIKDFADNLKYLFNIWGGSESENYVCSINNNQTACNAAGSCKWIRDGTLGYCIPNDAVNKSEYSKFILLFLLLAILVSFFNKYTKSVFLPSFIFEMFFFT